MDPSTSSSGGNLGNRFENLFEVSAALDASGIEMVYWIRRNASRREFGWEPIRSNGLELGDHDQHSVPCLASQCDTAKLPGPLPVVPDWARAVWGDARRRAGSASVVRTGNQPF